MELVTVAAVAANGVIGRNGELPWPSIPADRRQYRTRVAEWPVILGRRTFESMREELPGAAQIVLSRSDPRYDIESVHPASGVDEAVDVAESLDADRAYVLGGGAIYALFRPVVDRMVLSRLPEAYDGDAYFPEWDRENWALVERTPHEEFALEEWAREP